jgi:hypothetical protein
VRRLTSHVSSDRLGEAARHASLDYLRDIERRHVEACERCRRLYGGYRLTDRLFAAQWREVKLPATALERPTRRAALAGLWADFAVGFEARRLAPFAAIAAVVLLVGTAVAVPRLLPAPAAVPSSPAGTPSVAPGTQAWPSSTSGPAASATTQASGSGKAPSSPPEPTPAVSAAETPQQLVLDTTRLGGDPVAWSPDGSHLLVLASGKVQVRDARGVVGGGVYGDAAAWFNSSTYAVATRSPTRGLETIRLVDTGGRVVGVLPGTYGMGSTPFAMLVGSGSGELAIASRDEAKTLGPSDPSASPSAASPSVASTEPGTPGWHFVLWNGRLSATHDGVPVAFTRDGRKLAVLHPGSVAGGNVTGWLEILATPSLETVAAFDGLTLRLGPGAMGSAYGLDASFSPDGRYLLASGTLVDVTSGSSFAAGKGGWLGDGSLVTASADGLLRWGSGHATLDPQFPGAGTVEASRHGELVYFYGDGKPALYLNGSGTLYALTLDGFGSIERLLIAPDGRTIALDGRATDGSSIAAVASLTR